MARLGRSRAAADRALFGHRAAGRGPHPSVLSLGPTRKQAYYDLTDPRVRDLSLAP